MSDDVSSMKRTVVIVGGIVSMLLVATIALVSVLITTTIREAENTRYKDCVNTLGIKHMTNTQDMADAAEWCSRN